MSLLNLEISMVIRGNRDGLFCEKVDTDMIRS